MAHLTRGLPELSIAASESALYRQGTREPSGARWSVWIDRGHRRHAPPEALGPLVGLPRLGWFGCAGGNIDDESMAALARLPRLREIDISGTHIISEGLAVFPPMFV